MEEYELKKIIEEKNSDFNDIKEHLDLDKLKQELEEKEKLTLEEGFYKDQNKSQVVLKDISFLKERIGDITKLITLNDNVQILLEFYKQEEISLEELEVETKEFVEELDKFKVKLLLNGKYDKNSAILTINAGAGGTESCDWVSMLYRMYDRWAMQNNFKIEVLDILPGDEAGIKSVTLSIKGDYAYGYLDCEKGVHRLVRISPFDSNARRHTSFAAVNVTPEIEDDVEVNLKKEDLKIDTYRASGAGGQHVNTTDSAVRITHLPTGIVVTCQNERSQNKNLNSAMKVLRAKLFEIEMKNRENELKDLKGTESKIEWGSQIRSYVFQPYKLVKDHRTNYEEGNVDKVMDGDINAFIDEYLKIR
ncbi:peptide chain release factor 2 [Streptobacillus felis]|uniref:peptide chain release factor 2 n=1 Tax=Streptobacillus felis TaxID=1384509 RepID=UPI0012E3470A|nr:peptide chain release factor 2 [Streptobacillus felis]